MISRMVQGKKMTGALAGYQAKAKAKPARPGRKKAKGGRRGAL